MEMYYINNTGIRSTASGGVLLDLYEIAAVGEYWPRSVETNAMFVVHMRDTRDISVTFSDDIPFHRHMEEHANLVNAVRRVRTKSLDVYKPIEFADAETTRYECKDPDGAWLMTGRALGGMAAWLYAQDKTDEQEATIKNLENFAAMVLGETAAMDEFMKARDTVKWEPVDEGRLWARDYGEPL